jgi:hypothetical protein
MPASLDVGHSDNFPWVFFTLLVAAGIIAQIRHWLLARWMGRQEMGDPRRGFEVIQQDQSSRFG